MNDVDAEKEILPELAPVRQLLQITVGCGNQAKVDRFSVIRAASSPFVRAPAEASLARESSGRRSRPKNRPSVALSQHSALTRTGSRKCTFFEAEKLALEQTVGNSGTVNWSERAISSTSHTMYAASK